MLCEICKTPIESKRIKKTCSIDCQKEKDRIRKLKTFHSAQMTPLQCIVCAASFFHKDPRKGTCTNKCAYLARAASLLARKGYANPAQKPRTEEEMAQIKERISTGVLKTSQVAKIKRAKTMQARYGKANLFRTPESNKKRADTLIKKYGTSSSTRAGFLSSIGFSNYDQFCKALIDFIEKNQCAVHSELVLNHFGCSREPLTTALSYSGRLDLLHKIKSSVENEIAEFLIQIGISSDHIHRNVRPPFMDGLELDLFIPSLNFAIEYHGLAMHSERPIFRSKNLSTVKTKHKTKYELAKKNNITLLQIFEDEWRDKRPIIESMIKAKLGKFSIKISGRVCEVKEITNELAKSFFNNNHIAEHTLSKNCWGLFYKDELVSAISVRAPFTKTNRPTIEIARFCSNLDTKVIGGFQKLLKQVLAWAQSQGYKQLLTYSDCRFGSGKVYEFAGFSLKGATLPNYFYESGGIRESRFKYKKNNEEAYIEAWGKSERAQNNNQDRYAIYDAGHLRWIMQIGSS